MGDHSGFFKGEKKKKKQNNIANQSVSTAPVFVLPKLVEKKKKAE